MVSKAGHVTHRLISWTNSPTDTVGPLRSYTVAFRTTWTNEQRSDLSWRLRLGLYYGAINPKNGNGYFQFWGSWEWAKEIRLGCVSRYGTPKCSSYFFGTSDAFFWCGWKCRCILGRYFLPLPKQPMPSPGRQRFCRASTHRHLGWKSMVFPIKNIGHWEKLWCLKGKSPCCWCIVVPLCSWVNITPWKLNMNPKMLIFVSVPPRSSPSNSQNLPNLLTPRVLRRKTSLGDKTGGRCWWWLWISSCFRWSSLVAKKPLWGAF